MLYSSSIQTLKEIGEIALITDIAKTIEADIVKNLSTSPIYTYYTVNYKNHIFTFQCNSNGYISVSTFLSEYEIYL